MKGTNAKGINMEDRAEYKTGTEPALTYRQRNVGHVMSSMANDLRRGNRGEQHTGALLDVVVDAIRHGYEAELVALVAAWRREVEREP